MLKTYRYSIGGYEGDQLQPLVRQILNDADAHPLRRVPLRELVDALRKHVTAFDPPGLDNIPEFDLGQLGPDDWSKHGEVMFANGVIEGLRQAIHAIETDRKENQPTRNWPGMNAAISAIERAITQRQADRR